MTVNEFLSHFQGVSGGSGQWSAICPGHADSNPSLSIRRDDSGKWLLNCHAGCDVPHVVESAGLLMKDLFPEVKAEEVFQSVQPTVVARYDYTDQSGSFLCQKSRDSNKKFYWSHKDQNGKFVKGRTGNPVPYNLAGIRDSDVIYFVEGEKDVETLRRLNKKATCLPDGAKSKWKDEFIPFFEGKNIYIIPDNDEPGKKYALGFAANVYQAAASVRIVDLKNVWPEIPEKGDITDVVEKKGDSIIEAVEFLAENSPCFVPGSESAPEKKALESASARDLLGKVFDEVFFVVMGLIHEGFVPLTAAPKTGKSWFALDLCVSVATGIKFLDHQAIRCGALYLALEDSYRRLYGRVSKVLKGRGLTRDDLPDDFRLAVAADPIGGGLEQQIEGYMKEFPSTRLVVIDVLERVRGSNTSRNKNAYQIDSAEMAKLKEMGDKYGLCLMVVHHTRKQKDDSDPFLQMSGSQGIVGAADEAIMLTKEDRMSDTATLTIISREMGDLQLVITFNRDKCIWEYTRTGEEQVEMIAFESYTRDPVTVAVRGMMKDYPLGFETKPGEFSVNMVKYTGESVSDREVGKRFKKYLTFFHRYDKILCEMPTGTTSKRAYRFTRLIDSNDLHDSNDLQMGIDDLVDKNESNEIM